MSKSKPAPVAPDAKYTAIFAPHVGPLADALKALGKAQGTLAGRYAAIGKAVLKAGANEADRPGILLAFKAFNNDPSRSACRPALNNVKAQVEARWADPSVVLYSQPSKGEDGEPTYKTLAADEFKGASYTPTQRPLSAATAATTPAPSTFPTPKAERVAAFLALKGVKGAMSTLRTALAPLAGMDALQAGMLLAAFAASAEAKAEAEVATADPFAAFG